MTVQTWEGVIDSTTKPLPTPSGLQQSAKQAEAGMNSLVSQLSGLWGQESGLCLREARVTPTESKFLRGHGHPNQTAHMEKVPRTREYSIGQKS